MDALRVLLPQTTCRASVITTESAEDLSLALGDEVRLVLNAIHVLPVKD